MNFRFLRIFRPVDFLIFLLFLGITIASFLFLRSDGKTEAHLIIKSSEKEYVYPLSKDREIEISGNIGKSLIVIHDGRAYFKSSPCSNKTCIHMGVVQEENDWAACLPNDIFIRVE